MPTSLLKPLFLVTEDQMSASVIYSLITTGERIVYMVSAGNYSSIASTLRTQYLMCGDDYYYIAVFNSNSDSNSVRDERLSMVKYLSGADMHTSNIGVFCFRNTLEKELELKLPKENDDKTELINILKVRRDNLQQYKTLCEIQEFVSTLK